MRIDWACAPFAVRLPPPQATCGSTAMPNVLFGEKILIDAGRPARSSTQRGCLKKPRRCFANRCLDTFGESAVLKAVHLRLEDFPWQRAGHAG